MVTNIYQPKVSIVIPAYNASNYLGEAIDCALNQTYKNLEIIVVNDGSKDNGATAAVAKKYSDKIVYLEKENGGSSSALNLGIKKMSGEWFSWLSHDDLYYPDKISKQIEFMNDLEVPESELINHVFFTGSELIDENGDLIKKSSINKMAMKAKKVENIIGNQYFVAEPTNFTFHGCGCLIHKSVFEKIGLFNEALRMVNDMDMWYRIYTNFYKIHLIPNILVQGRIHAEQISRIIGYSYHNEEQDMFWNRSLQWLINNYPDDFNLYYLFGKNAYLKTRYEEAKKAFDIASSISHDKKLFLFIKKYEFIFRAEIRTLAKKIYILIK